MAKARQNHKRLTSAFVAGVKAQGSYGDSGRGSHGLHLIVTATGSKKWRQRIRFNGKLTNMGLGDAGEVTLAEARATAAARSSAIGRHLWQSPPSAIALSLPWRTGGADGSSPIAPPKRESTGNA